MWAENFVYVYEHKRIRVDRALALVYQHVYPVFFQMSKETLLPIRWLAPEAFLYGKFSLKSDTYAYGVVLWEIFTFGLQPYYGYTNKEVMDFIQKVLFRENENLFLFKKDSFHYSEQKRA